MWHWLAFLTAPALVQERDYYRDLARDAKSQNAAYERMIEDLARANSKLMRQLETLTHDVNQLLNVNSGAALPERAEEERIMAQDNEQTNETVAGNVVGGAGNVLETTARQVEGAAKEATEFASDSVLARLLGYIRAANNLLDAGLQGGLDVKKDVGQSVMRELEEFNQKAKQEITGATGGREGK